MTASCQHYKTLYNNKSDYLLIWSLPRVSSINNFVCSTSKYPINEDYSEDYSAEVHIAEDSIKFIIVTNKHKLKCIVSMYVGKETLLLSNTLNEPTRTVDSPQRYYYDLVQLSLQDDCYKTLKQHPSDNLIFICKLKPEKDKTTFLKRNCSCDSLVKYFSSTHLKKVKAAFENSSESHLNDQVILRVGEKDVNVNKAILCAQSLVFAQMFQNDKKGLKENIVTINDIKVDVIKALVYFLYTGKLQKWDFEFLCELYYASNKYLIDGLLHICFDLILTRFSIKNVIQVLKFAFLHHDVRLKSAVLLFIEANMEDLISTEDWINLLDKEPKLALEVLKILDL